MLYTSQNRRTDGLGPVLEVSSFSTNTRSCLPLLRQISIVQNRTRHRRAAVSARPHYGFVPGKHDAAWQPIPRYPEDWDLGCWRPHVECNKVWLFSTKDILVENSNYSYYALVFNLHDLLEHLRIFAQKLITNCPSPELLRGAEILPKTSSFCLECNNVTDRQTDRQTDRRTDRQMDGRQTDGLYIHLYLPKTVEICELYSYTKINNMLK